MYAAFCENEYGSQLPGLKTDVENDFLTFNGVRIWGTRRYIPTKNSQEYPPESFASTVHQSRSEGSPLDPGNKVVRFSCNPP